MFKGKNEIVFGYHPVLEAVSSGVNIDKVLIANNIPRSKYEEIVYYCRRRNIPVQFVPREKLSRITNMNHQGFIALNALIEYQDIEQIIPWLYEEGKEPLILILDGVTDVRNFGSIARTAECAGVDALVIPVRGTAQINSEALKTSAGALSRLPVCRVNSLPETVEWLKNYGLKIYAVTEKGNQPYFREKFDAPAAFILGDEEKGISQPLLEMADQQLFIPMKGNISSLNVAVATGIILFEAIKNKE